MILKLFYKIRRQVGRLVLALLGRKVFLKIKPDVRTFLAKKYLKGNGLEIGALHRPLILPRRAKVKYVDRMPAGELREQYPELSALPLVTVDIIDNGESLNNIKNNSQDFVIANHFIEHCENPIKTLKEFLRVLKSGGIIYLTVPDKRFTFDKERPITELSHLIKDYNDGPEWHKKEHFKEWAKYVKHAPPELLEQETEQLLNCNYSIHYHVWTYFELFELFICLKKELNFGFEIIEFVFNPPESIFIIKKEDKAGG